MKKSGEDRLKYAINESTLSTAARSPFPSGEGKKEAASPHLLEDRLMYAVCESTLSTAGAVPLPRWGRLRYENTVIPETQPFPRGEGKEEAVSPHFQKRYYSNTFFPVRS